jgi:hypothetical protein
MNNNNNDNTKNDPSKTPGQGTQQGGDQGKQSTAPRKDQDDAGTEKREAGIGTDKK